MIYVGFADSEHPLQTWPDFLAAIEAGLMQIISFEPRRLRVLAKRNGIGVHT
jgi:hypothetical protein